MAQGAIDVRIPIKEGWRRLVQVVQSANDNEWITWKTWLVFKVSLGFEARTTIFDCIFTPTFAKRVLIGKGEGNNISAWKNAGTIMFRKPHPEDRIYSPILKSMTSRLERFLLENGIRLIIQRETAPQSSDGKEGDDVEQEESTV